MEHNNTNKVYILSGPAGVGKSTTSKALVNTFSNSAYISGDYVSHMHIKGRKKPWESEKENSLIWNNILSLTRNFLNAGNDVVVDFVTFPQEAKWLHEKLKDLKVDVIYVVLWADNQTIINRDNTRIPENRMGERCLILVNEFKESVLDERYFLDTSRNTTQDFTSVLNEIRNNQKYKII
ncbi:AAA family ATPase [Gottfriedia sp. NPDC056225]|uniref:AAA family ATPase n=1 Tax=Gottfriedia sp. NPDC056225 TaxID=3345751 RepID=UPI0035D94474